jgi:hypothetical protein
MGISVKMRLRWAPTEDARPGNRSEPALDGYRLLQYDLLLGKRYALRPRP